MLPVEPPLQSTFTVLVELTLKLDDGSLTVTLAVLVHPLASLMPMVYVPALKLENVLLVPYVPPPML